MKPYYEHAGITICPLCKGGPLDGHVAGCAAFVKDIPYHEFDKSFDEVKFMYDPKCEELAEYFLDDLEHQPEEVQWLAQDIQDQIERWLRPPS